MCLVGRLTLSSDSRLAREGVAPNSPEEALPWTRRGLGIYTL